ncbi:MAG: PIG-L deacetylase family protein [Acidimicrobiia bacterium]|nr:PIG-L deacetylase family protein [Acidimicrobiia bacterium]
MTAIHTQPGPAPLDPPERVLVIGAHPDDAEFGAGATLARWADAGTHITLCVVTDGSKGSWDPHESASDLVARRKEEQRAAARVLGIARTIHLDHVDGELVYSMDLRTEIAMQIRIQQPDIVLGHDPWQRYQLHPDHRACGLATVDGVVTAREPRFELASGVDAHRPDAVLLWSADEPDHAEPVDPASFDRKVSALLCHRSQAETTMGDAGSSPDATRAFEKQLSAWQDEAGARFNAGPAETFKRITP